jgi:hypothetical protein
MILCSTLSKQAVLWLQWLAEGIKYYFGNVGYVLFGYGSEYIPSRSTELICRQHSGNEHEIIKGIGRVNYSILSVLSCQKPEKLLGSM